jgi:hypothetical protein
MRRKIIRRARPVNTGETVKLVSFIAIMLMCLALFVFIAIDAMRDFNEYKQTWDTENQCIAYMIRLGIERKDIHRSNGTCVIGD